MNRRDFIKKSAIATGAVAGASMLRSTPSFANTRSILSKEHNSIDDVMNISKDYKRFDQKNTAFNVATWSLPTPFTASYAQKGEVENWKFSDFPTGQDSNDPHVIEQLPKALVNVLMNDKLMPPEMTAKAGYTQLDMAYLKGAGALETLSGSVFSRAFSASSGPVAKVQLPNGNTMPMALSLFKDRFPTGFEVHPNKWQFDSKEQATYAIKKATKAFGASLVGIAPYDERWTYNTEVHVPFDAITNQINLDTFNIERKVEFGFEPKSVIVIIHEMDYEAMKTSPSLIANGAVSVQYSAMLEVSLKVAKYVRGLGYNSRHSGNDTALSVPIAISAGLGESSRMGLLITEEYGPRVRISKVFTDMELTYDKPKTFGVKKFCEVCLKCADNCPSNSISTAKKTTDPDNVSPNRCNNKGVDKWYNDHQKCFTFWGDNYGSCGNCVSCCPYNKVDVWHHDVAEIATKLPLLRNAARYLDEIFKYGLVDHEPYMVDYWRKDI